MITDEQKELLSKLIANMDSEKHYWFLRTMGGNFFEEFYNDGFVAIGYDEILMKNLRDLPERDDEARAMLKVLLDTRNRDLTLAQTAKAAGQILKFYREMNKGDVVVIPGYQSKYFAFGIVESELYEDNMEHSEGQCPFIKKRRIKWLKRVGRSQLDSKFLLGLGNQQTMSCIDSYAEFIDRKIQQLYTKGDKTYLILRVNQDKGLTWDDFCFIADLGDLFKGISEKNGVDVDLTKIDMRINVQSPGDILMICPDGMGYLLPLALIVLSCVALPGGHVKFLGMEIKTNGLGSFIRQIAEAVTLYLDHKQERKLRLQERIQNLQIEHISENENTVSESLEEYPSSSSPAQLTDDSEQKESPV